MNCKHLDLGKWGILKRNKKKTKRMKKENHIQKRKQNKITHNAKQNKNNENENETRRRRRVCNNLKFQAKAMLFNRTLTVTESRQHCEINSSKSEQKPRWLTLNMASQRKYISLKTQRNAYIHNKHTHTYNTYIHNCIKRMQIQRRSKHT